MPGGSCLLFITGIDGRAELFGARLQGPLEQAGWQVLTYEHWDSGRRAAWESIDSLAADVRAHLDRRGIARAVIMGESFGGTIAQVFAQRYPAATDRLVLVSTFAYLPFPVRRRLVRSLYPILAGGARLTPPWAMRLGRRIGNPVIDRADEPAFREAYYRGTIPVAADLMLKTRLALGFDARPWLSEVEVPTLIVAGRRDRLIPWTCGEALHHLIPGSQFHVIENSGHMAHVARPEEFLRVFHAWHAGGRVARP